MKIQKIKESALGYRIEWSKSENNNNGETTCYESVYVNECPPEVQGPNTPVSKQLWNLCGNDLDNVLTEFGIEWGNDESLITYLEAIGVLEETPYTASLVGGEVAPYQESIQEGEDSDQGAWDRVQDEFSKLVKNSDWEKASSFKSSVLKNKDHPLYSKMSSLEKALDKASYPAKSSLSVKTAGTKKMLNLNKKILSLYKSYQSKKESISMKKKVQEACASNVKIEWLDKAVMVKFNEEKLWGMEGNSTVNFLNENAIKWGDNFALTTYLEATGVLKEEEYTTNLVGGEVSKADKDELEEVEKDENGKYPFEKGYVKKDEEDDEKKDDDKKEDKKEESRKLNPEGKKLVIEEGDKVLRNKKGEWKIIPSRVVKESKGDISGKRTFILEKEDKLVREADGSFVITSARVVREKAEAKKPAKKVEAKTEKKIESKKPVKK